MKFRLSFDVQLSIFKPKEIILSNRTRVYKIQSNNDGTLHILNDSIKTIRNIFNSNSPFFGCITLH